MMIALFTPNAEGNWRDKHDIIQNFIPHSLIQVKNNRELLGSKLLILVYTCNIAQKVLWIDFMLAVNCLVNKLEISCVRNIMNSRFIAMAYE